MNRNEIIEKLEPYLNEEDIGFVKEYLDAKEAYLKDPTQKNSFAMSCAFHDVFFIIKQPMVRGEFNLQQFDDFIELIQEGL